MTPRLVWCSMPWTVEYSSQRYAIHVNIKLDTSCFFCCCVQLETFKIRHRHIFSFTLTRPMVCPLLSNVAVPRPPPCFYAGLCGHSRPGREVRGETLEALPGYRGDGEAKGRLPLPRRQCRQYLCEGQ